MPMRSCSKPRRSLCAALLVSFLVAIGGPVGAQEAPDLEAAKTAFKAGQDYMKTKQYGEAIVEFNKAYAITKDGLVMGQVALAYEKAGDYDAALSAIRVYREALPEGDRDSVDALIRKYEAFLAEGKGQRLTLPGEQVQADPEAAAEGGGVGGGMLTTEGSKAKTTSRGDRRIWTWVAAGTAAALGISALVVGLSAKSKFDELEDRCGPDQLGVCQQDEVDSVKGRAIATDVLWGTALAAGVAAGVLYFLEKPKSAAEKEKNLLDDEEVEDDSIVRRLRLTPVAGGGSYGLGAQLNY